MADVCGRRVCGLEETESYVGGWEVGAVAEEVDGDVGRRNLVVEGVGGKCAVGVLAGALLNTFGGRGGVQSHFYFSEGGWV